MKLLIVGYGKMGRMVEEMAAGQDIQIVGRVDDGRDEWRPADVAVDFSTASALLTNFSKYMQSKTNVVIGTTGWGEHAAKLRRDAEQAGLGVVAAAKFLDRREHFSARGRRDCADDAGPAAVWRLGA
jgi:4-hydroxy-tetrahydrodipicolinate reductase